MSDEKKIVEEVGTVSGGLASGLASSNTDYDRCPMCDNPTPVGPGGRCHCSSCGHSWTAGSH